jgi:hypothetical protein
MRYLTLLCLLFISACAAPPVKQNILGESLDPKIVRTLMLQAVKYSRYSMPSKLPAIDLIPESVWLKTKCPGLESRKCPLLGYYIDFRPDEVDVVHVRDVPARFMRPYQGVAVHELVHWLQSHNGRRYDQNNCPLLAANELEAYAVEYVNDLANGRLRSFEMSNILSGCYIAAAAKTMRKQ